ncbi:MAG: hypothetical protein ACKOAD_07615 [Gammaproteobacteria bacterium]
MNKDMRLLRYFGLLMGLSLSTPVVFAEAEVKVNGFVNAGSLISDVEQVGYRDVSSAGGVLVIRNNSKRPLYDSSIGSRANFDYPSLLGVQVESKFNDKWSAVGQLVSTGLNDYKTEAEWLFAKYQANDKLNFRAGRLRFPAFLMSEYLKVGYAYPWITPPRNVYVQIPNGLANFTGVDFTYNTVAMNQDLGFSMFTGGSDTEITAPGNEKITLQSRRALGGNLTFGNEKLSVRGGYACGNFTFKTLPTPVQMIKNFMNGGVVAATAVSPLLAPVQTHYASAGSLGQGGYPSLATYLDIQNKWGNFWGVGYKLDWNNVYSLGEFTRRRIAGWLPDTYGWYATLGYRVTEQLLPTLTYSQYRVTSMHKLNAIPTELNATAFTATAPTSPAPNVASVLEAYKLALQGLKDYYYTAEDTCILGVKYDIADGVALKANYNRVMPKKGTQGLFDTRPAKRHVNIYGLAVNVVF